MSLRPGNAAIKGWLFSSVKSGTCYKTHDGGQSIGSGSPVGPTQMTKLWRPCTRGGDSGKLKVHPAATLKMGQWDTGESGPLGWILRQMISGRPGLSGYKMTICDRSGAEITQYLPEHSEMNDCM